MKARGSEGPIVIGIVAGEPSGDALGAGLISAVRARLPDARFVGIGGPRMESAGCEIWYPMATLSLRGYAEVVAHLPGLLRMRRQLRKRLRAAEALLFVGIDAPDFNLALEAKLKRRGVRTIHYVSPSVWAWRRERIDTIAKSADRLLALFPFEPALYRDAGLTVDFVGHPLASDAASESSRREIRDMMRISPSRPLFALLPGSRMSELEMHSEVLLRTAANIAEVIPEAKFVVPLVSRETRRHFEDVQYRLHLDVLPISLLYGHADHALKAADVGIVASGTATLEAAMARCPHLVYYRVNRITFRIVMRKLLLPYVGLPNVLAGRFVVSEFLQEEATADNLARAAVNLYDDTVTRHRLEALFASMARELAADTSAIVARAVTAELRAAGVAC